MQAYLAYAVRFTKPSQSVTSNDYTSAGVFSGYDSKTIQVVTKDGVLNLNFDQNTLFQKYSAPPSNGTGVIAPSSSSSTDFFKNVAFGSVIQVFYSKADLKATQVNYSELTKPVL